MTIEEVEEALESAKGGLKVYEEQYPHLKEQIKFQKVIINVLEKQIPKKLKVTISTRRCPNCNKQMSGIGNLHKQFKFCKWCGQALDWSEE